MPFKLVQKTNSTKANWLEMSVNGGALLLGIVRDAAGFAPIPYLKQAAGVTLRIVEVVQQLKGNKAAFRRLAEDATGLIATIFDRYKNSQDLASWPPPEIAQIIYELLRTLRGILQFAKDQVHKNPAIRLINSKADVGKVKEYRERLQAAVEKFQNIFKISSHLSLNESVALILKKLNQQEQQAGSHPTPFEEASEFQAMIEADRRMRAEMDVKAAEERRQKRFKAYQELEAELLKFEEAYHDIPLLRAEYELPRRGQEMARQPEELDELRRQWEAEKQARRKSAGSRGSSARPRRANTAGSDHDIPLLRAEYELPRRGQEMARQPKELDEKRRQWAAERQARRKSAGSRGSSARPSLANTAGSDHDIPLLRAEYELPRRGQEMARQPEELDEQRRQWAAERQARRKSAGSRGSSARPSLANTAGSGRSSGTPIPAGWPSRPILDRWFYNSAVSGSMNADEPLMHEVAYKQYEEKEQPHLSKPEPGRKGSHSNKSKVEYYDEEGSDEPVISNSSEEYSTDEEERERRQRQEEGARRQRREDGTRRSAEKAASKETARLLHLAQLGLMSATGQPYSLLPSQPSPFNNPAAGYAPPQPEPHYSSPISGPYPQALYYPAPPISFHSPSAPGWYPSPFFLPHGYFSPPQGLFNLHNGNVLNNPISNIGDNNSRTNAQEPRQPTRGTGYR
ncbi:hypothetical protein D9613_004497 [Agrocybe pediades]|uniref:Uncharacterized protein n=1 Tax=Agrocybe pediades TaxID=84607 RepID=A0A8H4VJ36_9AGAR|nr:hypothetical protein D9613_004497 [Agrocybe pediades]